jgi:hypothetical protein
MARVTGLEPATSGVTGRRSNQLSYTRLIQAGRRMPRTGNRFELTIGAPKGIPRGASDGARTRDLRRDRPAL